MTNSTLAMFCDIDALFPGEPTNDIDLLRTHRQAARTRAFDA
jgi:hypothetical protein